MTSNMEKVLEMKIKQIIKICKKDEVEQAIERALGEIGLNKFYEMGGLNEIQM